MAAILLRVSLFFLLLVAFAWSLGLAVFDGYGIVSWLLPLGFLGALTLAIAMVLGERDTNA